MAFLCCPDSVKETYTHENNEVQFEVCWHLYAKRKIILINNIYLSIIMHCGLLQSTYTLIYPCFLLVQNNLPTDPLVNFFVTESPHLFLEVFALETLGITYELHFSYCVTNNPSILSCNVMDIVIPDVNYQVPIKLDNKTLSCITDYASAGAENFKLS